MPLNDRQRRLPAEYAPYQGIRRSDAWLSGGV